MKNLFKALLAVCAVCLTTGVNAGVIVGDKEWRQVTDTVNFSWNDFSGVCSTSDGSCSGDLTNGTLGTVSFDGWTWASQGDVAELFQGLNGWNGPTLPVVSFSHSSLFATWAPDFFNTLGFFHTLDVVSDVRTYGLVRNLCLYCGTVGIAFMPWISLNVDDNDELAEAVTIGIVNDFFADEAVGGWFYRDAPVPAPPTLALLLVPALMIVAVRRKPFSH